MVSQKWIPALASTVFAAVTITVMATKITVSWPALIALGILAVFTITMFAMFRPSAVKLEGKYKGAEGALTMGPTEATERTQQKKTKASTRSKSHRANPKSSSTIP